MNEQLRDQLAALTPEQCGELYDLFTDTREGVATNFGIMLDIIWTKAYTAGESSASLSAAEHAEFIA